MSVVNVAEALCYGCSGQQTYKICPDVTPSLANIGREGEGICNPRDICRHRRLHAGNWLVVFVARNCFILDTSVADHNDAAYSIPGEDTGRGKCVKTWQVVMYSVLTQEFAAWPKKVERPPSDMALHIPCYARTLQESKCLQ